MRAIQGNYSTPAGGINPPAGKGMGFLNLHNPLRRCHCTYDLVHVGDATGAEFIAQLEMVDAGATRENSRALKFERFQLSQHLRAFCGKLDPGIEKHNGIRSRTDINIRLQEFLNEDGS